MSTMAHSSGQDSADRLPGRYRQSNPAPSTMAAMPARRTELRTDLFRKRQATLF